MRGFAGRGARAVYLAFFALSVTLASGFAQPPPDAGPPHAGEPLPRPISPIVRPTFMPPPSSAISPSTQPSASAARATPLSMHAVLPDSVLGPRERLAGPPLPKMTTQNTIYVSAGQSFDTGRGARHRMSISGSVTVTPSASGSCSGSVGTIYNISCIVSWQVINIDHTANLHQDYYIDASGANADTDQTVGTTYQPIRCSGTVSATGYCGNSHTQTLSDAGVYVLASAVCNNNGGSGSSCGGISYWETVQYIVVTTSSTSTKSYADAGQTIETTNYFVPSSGTTNVYILVNGLTVNDTYVVYVEFTSYLPACVYLAPFGAATANQKLNQLCDPNKVTGFKANQLSGSVTWPVNSTYSPGTYSVIVFDQTSQKRVAQRQLALDGQAGSGNAAVSLTPIAGTVTSPTPAPQVTASPLVTPAPPMQRFAYDTPSEASDAGANIGVTGLSANGTYALGINDPNGYTAPVNFGNFNANGGGSFTAALTFDTTTEPQNYAPNTYTLYTIQYGTSNIVGSAGFQIVGYNATTQFTDAAGTSVTGTALTIAKSSSVVGGIQFLNDSDSVYGASNGDALRGIFLTTNRSGISLLPACGTACVVTDSAGHQWNLTITTSSGNGTNADTDLLLLPVNSSTTLANGQYITVANVTFKNTAGNSGCSTGCQGYTQILPVDGLTWSGFNSNAASNPVYFTNSAGDTWSASSVMTHLGTVPTGTGYGSGGTKSGYEVHGYDSGLLQAQTVSSTSFTTDALYALNEPYNASSGTTDVYSFTVTNNSSQGGGGAVTFTGLQITFPSSYIPSAASTTLSVDTNTPAKWAKVTGGTGVPSTCANVNVICLATTGGNAGIGGGGGVQTIYVDVNGLPPNSFSAQEINVAAYSPSTVPASAGVSGLTLPVGTVNPYTLDALAVSAYSLDSSLMSGYISPSSVGTSTDYPVTFTIKNASTGQDANPDYLDAIVIDDPSDVLNAGALATPLPSPAPSPAGWSLLASKSDGSGGTLYWFGVCTGNYNWSDGPPTSGQPPVNASLPKCSTAASEYNAIAPGGSFTFQANAQAPSSSGTINFTMWAHGANGDGWSSARTLPLSVTPISAVSGFSNAGGASLPGTGVTQPNEPALYGDTSTTNGNAFTYLIKNTSSSGPSNNITSAQIALPYQTDTGSAGYDSSNIYWTLEPATPSITVNLIAANGSSSASGCSVSTQQASASGNGYIKLSGCTLQPGQTWQAQFYLKMPYLPNTEFQFPATVNNGAIATSENWAGDAYVKLLLGASMLITVDPTPDPANGGNPSPSCVPCTYTAGTTPQINFGTVANLGSATGTDTVMIQVYTDAATPYGGWSLYENIDSNPANTGSPANEFLSKIDSTNSTGSAGVTYSNNSAYTIMPTSIPGLLIGSTSSTNGARRQPFDIVTSYQVNIQGGSTSAQTRTITFTYISN